MFKKIFFIITSVLLIMTAMALVVIAPYHIYTLTLTEGVSTSFLAMKPSPPAFYDGQKILFKMDLENARESNSLYRQFHFSYFEMPFPFNNSIFAMIPTIKNEINGSRLGSRFVDGNDSEMFSFELIKNYKLETTFGDQKLFILPLFKNHILRKLDEDVWRDLFFKKISLPSNAGKSFYESLLALRKVSYNDLVYNLFILYNRTHLFPQNTLGIYFNEQTHHGLIKLPSGDLKYSTERLFIIDKGIIYSMNIRTRLNDIASENLREHILKETIFKNSNTDSAIPIYAQYKNLSYTNRIDQQGMTYLFSAWSHDISNPDFVRVIILFLERGKSNLKYLMPFYDYAYKKFGSNFTKESNLLLESAEEKLKRRIKEELEVEVKKEEKDVKSKFDGNFSTPDEKIKFYLQKAKDKNVNSDDSEKMLIQE